MKKNIDIQFRQKKTIFARTHTIEKKYNKTQKNKHKLCERYQPHTHTQREREREFRRAPPSVHVCSGSLLPQQCIYLSFFVSVSSSASSRTSSSFSSSSSSSFFFSSSMTALPSASISGFSSANPYSFARFLSTG